MLWVYNNIVFKKQESDTICANSHVILYTQRQKLKVEESVKGDICSAWKSFGRDE